MAEERIAEITSSSAPRSYSILVPFVSSLRPATPPTQAGPQPCRDKYIFKNDTSRFPQFPNYPRHTRPSPRSFHSSPSPQTASTGSVPQEMQPRP
ncbi:hypothetical protein E2C01_040733 [Portunus trituberculatus]|uniref:Uncharacterized protein n=1 Tax=Portunus trituberculatus TaxID=210409 RepID=A0A5B7FP05_PORTR|nr:hypothetical protein [Portunus trituberculatus]